MMRGSWRFRSSGRGAVVGGGAGGTPLFASTFDGTNDYLLRGGDLTGAVDGKTFLLSLWFHRAGGDGTHRQFIRNRDSGNVVRFHARLGADNKIYVIAATPGGGSVVSLTSAATFTDSTWHHVLAAGDAASASNCQLYIDGADATPVVAAANAVADFTAADWAIGAIPNTAAEKWNGDLTEVYFAPNQWMDITTAANLAKFRRGGRPADLGPTGSRPTGTSPLVYLRHPYSQFGVNSGTGGNFTITGALTAATTRP